MRRGTGHPALPLGPLSHPERLILLYFSRSVLKFHDFSKCSQLFLASGTLSVCTSAWPSSLPTNTHAHTRAHTLLPSPRLVSACPLWAPAAQRFCTATLTTLTTESSEGGRPGLAWSLLRPQPACCLGRAQSRRLKGYLSMASHAALSFTRRKNSVPLSSRPY